MTTQTLQILNVGQHTLAVHGFNETLKSTPIICIHGITSSVNFWVREQSPYIKAQRWYSLSLLGHYPSTFPADFAPEHLTPELIADLTSEAIRQLVGDQPVILIGHSTGGFTALAVAARHPEQVKAAVSVSGFAHGYWTGVLRLLQMEARMGALGKLLFKLNLRTVTSTYAIYKAMLRFYTADQQAFYNYPNLDANIRDQYPYATQLDLDAMFAFFNRMPEIDITNWLPKISAPTLAIAGDADPIVPPEQAKIIAHTVPNATLHMIEGAGHLPMLEKPTAYHAPLNDWIAQFLE